MASQTLLSYGAKRQAIGEFIRASKKNPHLVWNGHAIQPNLEPLFRVLTSDELAERVTVLRPTLRYGLWNLLRREGVFLPEVILRDSSWLDSASFIRHGLEALFATKAPELVLKDCELWNSRYPVLRTCAALEFRALELLGRNDEAIARAKALWEFDVYNGTSAWDYWRLKGKEGCGNFCRIQKNTVVLFGRLAAGCIEKESDFLLNYIGLQKAFRVANQRIFELSQHYYRVLEVFDSANEGLSATSLTLICEKNAVRWEEKLKVKFECR